MGNTAAIRCVSPLRAYQYWRCRISPEKKSTRASVPLNMPNVSEKVAASPLARLISRIVTTLVDTPLTPSVCPGLLCLDAALGAQTLKVCVCVFITAGPSTKLFTWGGGGDMGGHVLRETRSRGLCGLVCPSRTSERGGEGDCVKEGGGEEGKCERERALERLRYYSPGH
jgi:hypothetical protein